MGTFHFKDYLFPCLDIDECIKNQRNCHKEANCRNTVGSYVCECNMYHTGNGTFCTGITLGSPEINGNLFFLVNMYIHICIIDACAMIVLSLQLN